MNIMKYYQSKGKYSFLSDQMYWYMYIPLCKQLEYNLYRHIHSGLFWMIHSEVPNEVSTE